MKIAIVGSSGYIAGYLIECLSVENDIDQVLKIDQTDDADIYLNLKRATEFKYNVLFDIDYVIFTAAISGPDKCSKEYEECWTVNVTGTSYFIRQAIQYGCRVLFFSSDAVFGDIPGEIYTELSATKAITPYGRMKKTVEDEFSDSSSFKAIRLSYVVSSKDRFVSYCLRCIKSQETADIYHPFYRNCIVIDDVVQVVSWLIHHWDEYSFSFLNVAGRELVSRVRIADEINRFMNNRLSYVISKPNDDFYLSRPPITQMKSLYLQKYYILTDDTFTEKIKREIEKIRDEY